MALKGRDVIIAVTLALFACRYAASWIPSLRWAAYAFVAGAISVALGLATLTAMSSWDPRTRPANRSPCPPSLAFISRRAWPDEVSALRERQVYSRQPIFPEAGKLSRAVDRFLDLLSRDFVRSWYRSISPHDTLPSEIDRVLRSSLSTLQDSLSGIDLADVLTSRVVPILTAHFHDFDEAEKAVRGKRLNRSVTESEELDLAIASRFRDGKLHPAASLSFPDTRAVQQDYLRRICVRILPLILPRNIWESRATAVLIREMVACAILFPVMQMLSDPDTWNQLMEGYGRAMLQDRSTVRKLRAALDEHASPKPHRLGKQAATIPRLTPGESDRTFEKFVRAIRKTSNLLDARRFRSEVASQLRRDRLADGQDPIYIRRLELGKRILDQKVQQLEASSAADGKQGQGQGQGQAPAPGQVPSAPAHAAQQILPKAPARPASAAAVRPQEVSLVRLLRNSTCLSYFMEYMDRQRLLSLVQFWLVVDGFRNPLEDDGLEEDEQHAAAPSALPMWTESDRMDLEQIEHAYLSKPELNVSDGAKEEVRLFLHSASKASPAQYYKARRAVLSAQATVLEEMQARHFQSFKKSELFYKCLAALEASAGSLNGNFSRPPSPRILAPQPQQQHPHTGPPQLVRGGSHSAARPPQLAPAATRSGSTSDLRSSPVRGNEHDRHGLGRSLDEDASPPLYDDDDLDADPLGESMHSVRTDDDSGSSVPDTRIVQAIEQALNTIMEDNRPQTAQDLRDSLFGIEDQSGQAGPAQSVFLRPDRPPVGDRTITQPRQEVDKPSLASLGLVSAASRIGVFVDDDLFGDEDRYLSDDGEEPGPAHDGDDEAEQIHEAAPGDLGLAEAIAGLTNDIDRIRAQEAVVDSLTRKAELTNNTAELRILRKSKASLEREMRRKELQRQQYIVQESDNSLYGKSTVKIKSVQVGKEDDGREFALYVVEVQRDGGEQMPAAYWVIARRYSEFHELHQRLRSRYASVRNLDFPPRRVVMKFQSEFLRKRRHALEGYLRALLLLPEVCRSRELRAFLSQRTITPGEDVGSRDGKRDMMTRLYDSVTDGVEDFLGNIAVLDQISVAGQNLIAAATSQFNSAGLGASIDGPTAAEAEAELNAFENKELEPFIKPICDIFLEVFELNRGNNWLRSRAMVMVLQQLLGGTIERKVRDNVRMLVREEAMLGYMDLVRDSIWPSGQLDLSPHPRSAAERARTSKEASLMLATLVPELAGSVVGRVNAQTASRRIFATFNNSRLNAHLAFTLLDEVVEVIFGRL